MTQPYASLIALGVKRVETRHYPAPRFAVGKPLAIHAARQSDESYQASCDPAMEPVFAERGILLPDGIPYRAIVAVAVLAASIQMPAAIEALTTFGGVPLTDEEWNFGNWQPGRWGWVLRDVRALPDPVPCRGNRGIWTLDGDVVRRISDQIYRGEMNR